MAVIVKTECQKCEAIHTDELDGVLILGYRKGEGGEMVYPQWYHDMPVRQALIGIVDYLKRELEDSASESGIGPYEFLIKLIQLARWSVLEEE